MPVGPAAMSVSEWTAEDGLSTIAMQGAGLGSWNLANEP